MSSDREYFKDVGSRPEHAEMLQEFAEKYRDKIPAATDWLVKRSKTDYYVFCLIRIVMQNKYPEQTPGLLIALHKYYALGPE